MEQCDKTGLDGNFLMSLLPHIFFYIVEHLYKIDLFVTLGIIFLFLIFYDILYARINFVFDFRPNLFFEF